MAKIILPPMCHYEFEQPQTLFAAETFPSGAVIAAKVADMTDHAIWCAIIDAAREEGVTDLYLLDKQFVIDALREKIERMEDTP